VDPVPLQKFRSVDEPVQKERIERQPIAIEDSLIGRGEFGAVVRAEIEWREPPAIITKTPACRAASTIRSRFV
jgi:hypothetical protein